MNVLELSLFVNVLKKSGKT